MTRPAPVKIAVAGALGRMGRAVIACAALRDDVEVVAQFDRPGVQGEDLISRDEAISIADVVIDFSAPPASADLAEQFAKREGPPLVIGSTGFSAYQNRAIQKASTRIPIVRSGNFSLGINLLLGFVGVAAQTLAAEGWDIEIIESHHRHKRDAPSGTALMLGEAAARGREAVLAEVAERGRDGPETVRAQGAIGFHALRGGGIVGDHYVIFASEGEVLTLSHSARDRSLFAEGALTAAVWIITQPPGLYDMQDVLGFSHPA